MSDFKKFNAAKLGKFSPSGGYATQYQKTRDKVVKDGKDTLSEAEIAARTRAGMVGDSPSTTADMTSLTYGPDGSDAKGNSGFTVSFQRAGGASVNVLSQIAGEMQFNEAASSDTVFFKAFLLAFNETFKPDWVNETIYGRADPVGMYKNTTRNISVGLMIPAATVGEGFENLARVQRLIQFLYPTYVDEQGAKVITQSPLLRLKVMNLATQGSAVDSAGGKGHAMTTFFNSNKAGDGLLGIMQNLTINHNVENPDLGSFEVQAGTIIPKAIEIQFDFAVIHEHHLGWSAERSESPGKSESLYEKSSEFSSPYFPYDVNVKEAKAAAAHLAPAPVINEEKKKPNPNDAIIQNGHAQMLQGAPLGTGDDYLDRAARAVQVDHEFYRDPLGSMQRMEDEINDEDMEDMNFGFTGGGRPY
tara:strand:- start:38371 stop:39621 length:1251 start_codon:yes stop_codon:yes gene_type:complete